MISLPGVGAIIRDKHNRVFMVCTERDKMTRWELPARIRRNGESIFLSLYRCVEEESSSKIIAQIKRPVCFALNKSKKKGHDFFGIFFECSYKANDVQLTEYSNVNIPNNLRQKITKTSFVDWHQLDKKEIHPQHLRILQILDEEPEKPLFTIVSDADAEHDFYNNHRTTLNPVVLEVADTLKNADMDSKQIVDIRKHVFDVGLSFPGEIRNKIIIPVVEKLERLLGKDKVFYDNHYTSQLAVPNLDLLLQSIYQDRTKLIVVFLCADYQKKEWCGLEFRVVRDLIKQRKFQRIMFIKTDDGHVEGIFGIDGYVKYEDNPDDIAGFIVERLRLIESQENTEE